MPVMTIICRDCGANFDWPQGSRGTQAATAEAVAPDRCPNCRARHASEAADTGDWSPGDLSTSRVSSHSRREQQMFPVLCAGCGKQTQVPFEPRHNRPVYCSQCFGKRRGGLPSPRSGTRSAW